MKKSVCFVFALIFLAVSVCPLFSGAIDVEPYVMWIPGTANGYVGVYCKKGEVAKPPSEIPEYTNANYFYNFIGWYDWRAQTGGTTEDLRSFVKEYYADPSWPKGEPFPEFDPLPVMEDTPYFAYFDKVPKKFVLTEGSTKVTIRDVTVLLNLLTGMDQPLREGADGDVNGDGWVSIKDVTGILLYLTYGVE